MGGLSIISQTALFGLQRCISIKSKVILCLYRYIIYIFGINLHYFNFQHILGPGLKASETNQAPNITARRNLMFLMVLLTIKIVFI